MQDGKRVKEEHFNHGNMPDPISDAVKQLQQQINEIKQSSERMFNESLRKDIAQLQQQVNELTERIEQMEGR